MGYHLGRGSNEAGCFLYLIFNFYYVNLYTILKIVKFGEIPIGENK